MNDASKIFTKGDRNLLYDILTGQADGTKGVKISCYRRKIEHKLGRMNKEIPEKYYLNLMIYRKSNRQDIWLAAYQVCEDERPGLFDALKKEQKEGVLVND